MMAAKRKKLTISTVRSISTSVAEPTDSSTAQVLEDLKKFRHISIFPERKQICEILESEMELLDSLVSCLVQDYAQLYKQEKGRTKYADFQVHWLEHIHQVATKGEALASSDAQDVDEPSDPVLASSSAAEKWSYIYAHAQAEMKEVNSDTNMMVLHSIAKSVFNKQQGRIHACKEEDKPSDSPSQPSPDDSLLRMCGAEIARMIKVRRKERSRRLKRRQQVDELDKELSILKGFCVPSEQKTSMEEEIPLGIRNLDETGYLWVPPPSFLPFLRKVDEVFRLQINENNFKKHGETLFKVAEAQFARQRDQLYRLFWTSMPRREDSNLLHALYDELWSKMINLRKEDWRASRQRVTTHKSGKTSDTTLMLRDELKPIAAKKTQ